ncbi:MAG TPA: single-stranded-DNA-specific exonuclease RecJ [Solirubrobacterales bacterium]|nr:single-stranded-DNA-specific exonuclease RecJ [Solirubrobacterales bacterium]
MPESAKAFAADPYDFAEARAVAEELGLSRPVAVTLVRRGYRTPAEARAFLAAEESHPPDAFEGMGEVVGLIWGAIEAGERITVHGDFDVDGVSATALMISTLRGLGADCDWLIPDRIADGYGLSSPNVEKLARRGTGLLITVDCGVTAVEQVKQAQDLGMEVIVTDHHQPGEELPPCLILHPQVSGYPFESLCGTAVAWKLACALRDGSAPPEADLDLVALATVADVVPLVGENRSLVKRGLAELRRTRRVGLRALMEAARVDPARLDEGDLGFRLAPRINAAGRLYRADAGVELLLCEDEERAKQIAAELGRANAERRATELEVDAAAEAARRELPEELKEANGLVLAGEGWHPGVVGIVASRLVERHHRPVVVISLDGEGGGRGSGRGIPGFDLHAALAACSEHLESFGGHKAAAGLSIRAANVEAFRRAFAVHAGEVLGPEDLRRTERIDAMVGGVGLGLDLAEELGRLAPFGMGNPGVRLMVPSARVTDVRTMGEEGKHARFSLHSGSHRALGVAFGRASLGVDDEDTLDAAVRLEVNHWNGAVEPRVVLREVYPLEVDADALSPHPCDCGDAEWWARFEAELGRELEPGAAGVERNSVMDRGSLHGSAEIARRHVVTHASSSPTATIAELVSSGAGVLAVAADASRRAALANGATGLARFNGGAALVACHRCGAETVAGLAARGRSGLALVDYAALAMAPDLAASFEHVVLVDAPRTALDVERVTTPFGPGSASGEGAPPLAPPGAADKAALLEVARAAMLAAERDEPGPEAASDRRRPGFLHPLFSEAEREFALGVLGRQAPSRETIAGVFRALRAAGRASGAELRAALAGPGPHPLAPETAARCLRVLRELGLVAGDTSAGEGSVGVVSSEGTDLERSAAFRIYSKEHSEARSFLQSQNFR